MTPEELAALLDSLSDEGAIRQAHEALGSQIAELRANAKTLDDATKLRELRAAQAKLHTELERRVEEAEAIAQALEETKDDLTPPTPKASDAPPATEDPDGDTDGDGDVDEDDVTEPDDKEKVLVTAAAKSKARTDQPVAEKETADTGRQPLPFVWAAAPGQSVVNHGTALDKTSLARLFEDARSKCMENPGTYVVASVPSYEELGENVVSIRDGVVRCDELVKAAQAKWAKEHNLAYEPDRVTAAICEPFEVIRQLAPFQGVTDTPFADIFPQTPMARLGLRLTKRNWGLSDMDAGFAMPFTGQDSVDEAVPSTWKPCITIPCPTTFDITAEELTACFKVRDDTLMSSPETVDDFQELLFVQRARRREQYLLAKFDAHADTINQTYEEALFPTGVDVLPKLAEAIATWLAHARYPNRINLDTYTLVLPPNLDLVLRLGQIKRAFGDNEMTVAEAEAYIRNLTGVGNVVWLRDNRNGGVGSQPQPLIQAAAADGNPEAVLADGVMDPLNVNYRVRLVAPGDAIYAVVGSMQTGLETDPQLLRQNMSQWFLKEWVGFGKNGANPWGTIDFRCLLPNGASVGFMTPVSCPAAS
jgi:hypothetical protein